MSLVSLLALWRRQRSVIVGFLALGALVGYLASSSLPTRYSAEAEVLLSATNYEPEYGALGALSAFEFEQVMSTKSTLIATPSIQVAAAERLRPGADELPATYEVTRAQGTQIIGIEATGDGADDVVDTVTAVAEEFVERENAKALAAVRTQADEIDARVASTETRLTEISTEINRLSNILADSDRSTSFALENLIGERNATSQKLATELLQRDQIEADLLRASRGASVLNVPQEAVVATPLPVGIVVALGAVVVGFVGLGVAAVRDELSDRIRSADDVERWSGRAPLGLVPAPRARQSKRRARRHRRAVTRATNQVLALSDPDRRTTVLAMAGPRSKPPTGPLADSFARSLSIAGAATLLVTLDLDLDVDLDVDVDVDQAAPRVLAFEDGDGPAPDRRPLERITLSKLLAHGTPEALPIHDLVVAIDRIEGRYDWIVLEAPPVLESGAIVPFLDGADVVVVAVTANRTTTGELAETMGLVEGSSQADSGFVVVGRS